MAVQGLQQNWEFGPLYLFIYRNKANFMKAEATQTARGPGDEAGPQA